MDEGQGSEAGYPGFMVMRPPRLLKNIGTLKRVAVAKLAGIRMISASFSGERLLFQPWLTVMVDEGPCVSVTGVYRTDTSLRNEPEEEGPVFCLRKSTWLSATDLALVKGASDFRSHLRGGEQVVDSFAFVNRSAGREAIGITEEFVTSMNTSELTLRAADRASSQFQFIKIEVGGEIRAFNIGYSPVTTSIDLVESALPEWLASVDRAVNVPGFQPDGPLTISIDRSVPELIG
ncbi:hypothetical protein ACFQZ8_01085 [Micromonospora azadirachtae]|uniref:Uncharacterized protein n=1 Tax=Micromonospora azadirachtae TaxID=1970735 RepID=A0ABW2ZV82_9ACTN